MIAIVDYGAGNLVSVKKALDWLGQECAITSDPGLVTKCEEDRASGRRPLCFHFGARGLGVTRMRLSMRIKRWRFRFLASAWECSGCLSGARNRRRLSGLGVLEGECERFPASVKSPHVGWNQIEVAPSSRLFRGVASSSFVYFTHSFRAPLTEFTVACCEYGGSFSAAVEREHLFGVQFHPEKSGETGLKILSNFCAL